MTATMPEQEIHPFSAPPSFAVWRQDLVARGIAPIIAIAGSRGKSAVTRLLDAICGKSGLSTVTWTNEGIDLRGRRQRGELRAWSRAMAQLQTGEIDLAIQELDWATVHAVGLPTASYPIAAITNLCGNSESCLTQAEARRAIQAREAVIRAVHHNGVVVLNGEDFAVAGEEHGNQPITVLVALSKDTPLLRVHLATGGGAAWVRTSRLMIGSERDSTAICATNELPFSLGGAASFHVHNALTAAAVATACGIGPADIRTALTAADQPLAAVPGSFTTVSLPGSIAIVDRLSPSWFLRPLLRAVAHTPHHRLLTVVGQLDAVPDADLAEVGRLLGRPGGALIVHSETVAPDRSARFRAGVAQNDVPPLLVRVGTERVALNRALKMVRQRDLLLVLADDAAAVLRSLERFGTSQQHVA